MPASSEIVFVGAKRTPFGKFGGSLALLSATQLAVVASKAALGEIPPQAIDHVVLGNVLQTSNDAPYLARHVGLHCGIPLTAPALTLNRLCGSGFEAIIQGARLLQLGEAQTVLVGGTENMSQAPYVLRNARFGYRLGNGELEDSLLSGLTDRYVGLPMAETAEKLAVQNEVLREDSNRYSALSQSRAQTATQSGILKREIAPIEIKVKGTIQKLDVDEHIRPGTTAESLAKLSPAFRKDGTVTAGNASGICDGAACLVMTTASHAKSKGWNILGRLLGHHTVGVDPSIMGIGPVEASRGALKKCGLSLDAIDLVEINEAFAAQYLSVEKQLGLPREKTNIHGGAIAIGHPLAASGARLTLHLLHALADKGGTGLASACIGGGQGTAVVVQV